MIVVVKDVSLPVLILLQMIARIAALRDVIVLKVSIIIGHFCVLNYFSSQVFYSFKS